LIRAQMNVNVSSCLIPYRKSNFYLDNGLVGFKFRLLLIKDLKIARRYPRWNQTNDTMRGALLLTPHA
jgi:hypothetical protein